MHDKIQKEIPEVMRAKDQVRLTTLRGVLAAFTNEAMALKRKPQDKLSDDEAISVIRRLVKQRKDSIEQFKNAGRQELVDKETKELEILSTYLPVQMSEDEVKKLVIEAVAQTGATSAADMGKVMGALMAKVKGKADGGLVSKLVREQLAN